LRAILSVHDKAGIVDLARELVGLGWEVYSTGGTKRTLEGAGVAVKSISELTGFPEILDGRVKTLHPAVHGGILARRDRPEHMEELARTGLGPIDLVAVNLYPFRETAARGAAEEEVLENIDIGGPTLIRAAAKNYPAVLVLVDPADYPEALERLRSGRADAEFRRRLAYKAFLHTAVYDSFIARYFAAEEPFPRTLPLVLTRALELRYGENPHQKAAFYVEESFSPTTSLVDARQLSGKPLSYNNILDLEAGLGAVGEFEGPAVAIIKHNNPCGLCVRERLVDAYLGALSGDPVAAFGGVVVLNRPVDEETAREMDKTHFDLILAPAFSPEARTILGRKRDLILLALDPFPGPPAWEVRRAGGGFLLQTADRLQESEFSPRTVTRRAPTPEELEDLFFAWRAVKHIRSNAIAIAREATLLGMGAGQPSRVVSVELAVKKAGERARGAVLASDAFFPFPDGVEVAAAAGVTAIIQPGGSVRDREVIEAADRYNIAMVFTGARHFRH